MGACGTTRARLGGGGLLLQVCTVTPTRLGRERLGWDAAVSELSRMERCFPDLPKVIQGASQTDRPCSVLSPTPLPNTKTGSVPYLTSINTMAS